MSKLMTDDDDLLMVLKMAHTHQYSCKGFKGKII